jgi:hypothetical protein
MAVVISLEHRRGRLLADARRRWAAARRIMEQWRADDLADPACAAIHRSLADVYSRLAEHHRSEAERHQTHEIIRERIAPQPPATPLAAHSEAATNPCTGRGSDAKSAMPEGRGMTRRRKGNCSVCRHPERGRIDYLLASGAAVSAVVRQFKLQRDAAYRHAKNHISDEYRRAVLVGPLKNVEHLQKLVAENGVSVLENYRSLYAGLVSRWLAALESSSDQTLCMLTARMTSLLESMGKISGELLPAVGNITVNNTQIISGATLATLADDLMLLVRKHPQIRDDLVAMLRERMAPALPPPPTVEHRANGSAHPDS